MDGMGERSPGCSQVSAFGRWMREGTTQRKAVGQEELMENVNDCMSEVLVRHLDRCYGTTAGGTPNPCSSSMVVGGQ